jgi:hypothetical protein
MIPTVTKFRIIRQGEVKPIFIESVGFQVAISDKGKNDWTFIDGSGLTVNELRGLFVNLPQDLQFPPLEKYANPIDEDSDIKTIVSLGGSKRCMDDVSYLSSHLISSYSKELQVSI